MRFEVEGYERRDEGEVMREEEQGIRKVISNEGLRMRDVG